MSRPDRTIAPRSPARSDAAGVTPRIAVVTGANQGLGLALAEGLARQLAPGDVVYLTGRDLDRVRSAAAGIREARAAVRAERLDVRHGTAVAAFADALAARHGGVDIVFSNAAARLTPADLADGTLVAAICPGLVDTEASRPWFADMSDAQTPAEAAVAPLRLALDPATNPAFYGELVQFDAVIPWR